MLRSGVFDEAIWAKRFDVMTVDTGVVLDSKAVNVNDCAGAECVSYFCYRMCDGDGGGVG
jgi:hypothetical protein